MLIVLSNKHRGMGNRIARFPLMRKSTFLNEKQNNRPRCFFFVASNTNPPPLCEPCQCLVYSPHTRRSLVYVALQPYPQ